MAGRYLLALGALALSSCEQATGADDRICETAPSDIAQGDWGPCVHKWAYRLAGSRDPARVVADAAVTACADAIAWQVSHADLSIIQGEGMPERQARIAFGEQIMESAPKIALFRVVQARAGNCDIP